MSNVQIVKNMFNVASNRGTSKVTRRGQEVYRIDINRNLIQLLHYHTKTLEVLHNEVKYLYGESRSDVDSINTVLSTLGFLQYFAVGYKPMNGGFYVYLKESREELFFNDYNNGFEFCTAINEHLTGENLSKNKIFKYQEVCLPTV